MIAERFLELFRAMGGDAFLSDAGEVVLDAPVSLLDAIRLRVDEIPIRELVAALEDERALAEARLHSRGIEPRCATTEANDVTAQTFDHAIAEVVP